MASQHSTHNPESSKELAVGELAKEDDNGGKMLTTEPNLKVDQPDDGVNKKAVSTVSSSPSVLSGIYAKVKAEAWVQCEHPKCLKWRRILKEEADKLGDADHWFCSLNKDPHHDSCDKEEEDYRAADRLVKKCQMVYKFSTLEEGTLVWAKSVGFCRWPALICPDPADNQYRILGEDGEVLSYHVEYLGAKHSHNWIHTRFVELYGTKELEDDDIGRLPGKDNKRRHSLTNLNKSQRYHYKGMNVQGAVEECKAWLDLTPKQRLEKCTFKFVPSEKAENKENQRENTRKRSGENLLEKAKKYKMDKDPKVSDKPRQPSFKKMKLKEKASLNTSPNLIGQLKADVEHVLIKKNMGPKSKRRPFGTKNIKSPTKDVQKELKKRKSGKPKKLKADLEKGISMGCEISDGDKFWTTFEYGNIDITFGDKEGLQKDKVGLDENQNLAIPQCDMIEHEMQGLPVPMDAVLPGYMSTEVPCSSFPPVSMNEITEAPHSLLNRSKEEKFTMDVETYVKNQETFDHDVRDFLKKHGGRLSRLPTWHNVPVTLYQIYLAVSDRGGYQVVCKKKQWRAVYRELSGNSQASSGNAAKLYYEKYLLAYEMYLSKQEYKHLIHTKESKTKRKPKETTKKKKVPTATLR